jgi:predicted DNA-binding protein with PD1-like motif
MKVVSKKGSQLILSFKRGEPYPEVLINFLEKNKIRGGFFIGLGGLEDPEIAFYDLKRKKYRSRKFDGVFEVLSLVGNVAIFSKKLVIHNHVVLGDKSYKVFGGHLISAEVGATLEIYFRKLDNNLKRLFDGKTGLGLLQ